MRPNSSVKRNLVVELIKAMDSKGTLPCSDSKAPALVETDHFRTPFRLFAMDGRAERSTPTHSLTM